MNHPHRLLAARSRSAPQGATPAAWQSQIRGEFQAHPHRLLTACSRSAPQGATPAAWQSQIRGVPGWGLAVRSAVISVCTQRGNVTGMLRVEAVAHRRRVVPVAARGRLV